MNKSSVLHAPSSAHQGEFLASGLVYQFALCVDDAANADSASSEGVVLLQNIRKLKQVDSAAIAKDQTVPMFLGYKFATEDDFLGHNGLSDKWITDGEGIVGLEMLPGIMIQEYVGVDYTNSSDVKIGGLDDSDWANASYGDKMYCSAAGQLTLATTTNVARALFVEIKTDWVTYKITSVAPAV